MKTLFALGASGVGALFAGGQLYAQQDLETSVPANWSASVGTLSISPNHYKMGSQSLRWDWSAGDVITINNPGINAADVTNFYKHTCDFWVWNGAAVPGGKLRVEFMNGSTPQYWFDFYTDYTGWRHAVRSYLYDMGKVSSPNATFTSVRITAPASGSGCFYFDAMRWVGDRFTRVRDPQNLDIAGYYSSTSTADAYAKVPDIAADPPTSAELAELATLRSRWLAANKGGSAPSASSVTSAGTSFAAMNIVEDANGIRGQVIGDDTSAYLSWPLTLARDYSWGTATANASRDKMLQFIRHLMDQGRFVANSGDSNYGFYDFEALSNALILMAPACDPEFKAKLYEAYRWSYQMGKHWTTDWGRNTDEIYLGVTQRLGAILFLSPTDAEAVRQLKGFRRYLERFCTFSEGCEDGIKVDGLGFHHNSHYNGYLYAYIPLTNALYNLRGTSFQATQLTYENFRHAVLTEMRMSAHNSGSGSSASVGYFGNSICGRHPFDTYVPYYRDDLRRLGEIGGAVYGQNADSVVARAYNRYFGVNDYALFTPYGVEDAPDGFLQFNYSPLGIYRRANWVASMRAPQRYFWSAEIFTDANLYGRYQSYGALEILYDGGRAMSGQRLDGWDWNHPPGTTTIALPDSKLIAEMGYVSQFERSQINFSGALAFHDGQSGLYAGNFQEDDIGANHNPSFVWRKSWFAFGNEIVCLGSDISNNDAVNPTATTLFQGALAAQGTAITLDGSAVTSFPYSNTASGSASHWMLDAQGTGFITQPGANVEISRSTQTSANHTGTGSPTTGNFAKAWFDHGTAPSSAGYEYAVFPATNATAMATAASDHSSASTKPYEVIERDSSAHVVKWKADGKIGYAIYSTTALPAATKNAGLISAVQRPCLLMAQSGGSNDAFLSVVDPDLNFSNPEANYGLADASAPRTLDLTLNGFWSLDNPPAGVSVVAASASTVTLRVTTQHGAAVHVHLLPAASEPAFAPVFSASNFTFPDATVGSAYSGSIASYASDANAGDTLTFSKVSGPAWLSVAANGDLSGTPGGSDSGANTFTVRVTDAGGLTADATLQIAVTSNGTMTNASGGSWQTASNWGAGTVAIGKDKTANFATLNLTADATVTLDGARTIGNLMFGDTTPSHGWTLATGSGGPLTLDVSSGSPTITVNNGTATLSVALAGTKGLTKAGSGTLVLTGVNTYTGLTTVGVNGTTNGGTLSLGGAQSLVGGLLINNGTVNFLGGSTVIVPAGVSINTAAGTGNNLRILNVAGVVSNAGTLNMPGGDTFNLNAGANWTQSGAMTVRPGSTFTSSILNVNAGAVFKYTGASAITLSASSGTNGGSGTLSLTGGTFQTGKGFVNSGGTAGSANLLFSNGGALKLTADVATLASNSGTTTPFNVQVGTGGSIIDTNGFSTTITQGIANVSGQTGSLTKQGAGTLTLSGANTYTGATTVTGGTLSGAGSFAGPVNVQVGGTLAPNGTLTVNNTLTLAGGVQMSLSKSGGTLTNDKVSGISTVTYGGTLTVNCLGSDPLMAGDSFPLFAATNYSSSFATINLPALTNGLVWNTSLLATNGSICVRAIPVAANDSMDTAEDVAGNFAVLANDSDADNDTLAIQSVTQGAHGAVAINGTQVTYTPAANWSGADSFEYTITDNKEGTATATVNVTVAAVNDVPVLAALVNANATENQPFAGNVSSSASDVDAGDTLTFSKAAGPAWLSVAPNGALSGTPTNGNVGANSFTIRVTDAAGAYAEQTLTIAVANVNDAPVFTANPINGSNATEDTTYAGSIADSATDVDAGETLRFSKTSGPAWLSVAANGAFSGTPTNSDVGANSFMVRVTDAAGAFATATLNITVANANDAPVFTVDPILAADASAGTAYTGQTLAGKATDADAGDALTYSKVSGPAWLTVSNNGALSGTPPTGSSGLNTFVVRVTDNASATDDAELRINVIALPLPWTNGDIGTSMLAGSTSHSSGTFTEAGSGALGGSSDKLQFVYQALSGDGEIIARVSSLQDTGNSSRVGVMIRDTLASNSKQIFMGLTGSGNYRWVRRSSTGGSNSTSNSSTGTVPNTWVRLTRVGNSITAFKSSTGSSWTTVGSTTVTLATNCYIGLAVSSGSDTTLNTSQFSNVSVTP